MSSPINQPKRILVRGVNWLGDAVMTTPALLRLREAFPEAHITLLTHAKLVSLWPGHPALDGVYTFADHESVWEVGRKLRFGHFDLALTLPNSPRSALELWIAKIPQRVGYAGPWRNWFLTKKVPPRPGAVPMHKRSPAEINQLIKTNAPAAPPPPATAHHIHQYLHLAAALGARPDSMPPFLAMSDTGVKDFVSAFGLDPSIPHFGLNPGAEYGPAKCWPEDRFIAAVIQVQRLRKCRWLIFGSKPQTDTAARITAAIEKACGTGTAINLAGRTSLAELCAGLKLCRVLLTNDSGPMHVAAALGTPVVVPFGSTSPELTGPGRVGDPRHHHLRAIPPAPCSPCFLRACPIDFRCMTAITVEQVVSAIAKTLPS